MIHADNLSKYYGPHAALKNVSFQVERGEILGFLGPNGAGKTTTMRILTAYMPPSDGSATVCGYDVFLDSLEVRKRVGYLPESVPLYNDMTVSRYLDFVAALRRVEDRPYYVREALAKVDLLERADMLIGRLSKGMRQRVGLAQAIVHNPDVLILDEPTLGLDPKQIMEVRALIRSLGGDHTVILSTHILSEVEHICHRVLIMNHGRIVAEDTPVGLASRLAGNEKVILKTLDAPAEAGKIIQALPQVKQVVTCEPNLFEIECVAGSDCRPDISALVVEKGWGLLQLNIASVSLEDIFLELTSEQKVAI